MNAYKISIFAILMSLLIASAFNRGIGYNKALSDLGGVYSTSSRNMDFGLEISGKLSEAKEETKFAWSVVEKAERLLANLRKREEISIPVTAGIQTSNTLLRWGLSRKPGNKPPDADPGAPELLRKYGGLYLGDREKKLLYLTFDEGYENGYTAKILDVLKSNGVQGVFFVTGPYLKEHQDLVRRMVEEGHIVGNHTVHHPSLPEVSDKELEEEILGLERAFHEKFGRNMKYLRPPKGEYSERTLAATQKLGYRNIFWSFAYDDWNREKVRGADYAYDMVMRNLHNGAILLLHAVSKDNADALDRIIKGAREKGYEFGSLDSLAG